MIRLTLRWYQCELNNFLGPAENFLLLSITYTDTNTLKMVKKCTIFLAVLNIRLSL